MMNTNLITPKKKNKTYAVAQSLVGLLASNKNLTIKQNFLSEKDICEKYNISRTTSRRALSQLVEKGYLSSRQGKGYEIKKIPSLNAMDTLRGKIGLILADANSFKEDKAVSVGYPVISGLTEQRNYLLEPVYLEKLSALDQAQYEGFLCCTGDRTLPVNINVPMVSVGLRPLSSIPNVTVDCRMIGFEMGTFLNKMGHRCIAILESSIQNNIDIAEEITAGIKESVKDKVKIIRWYEGRKYLPHEATINLLKSFPEITALLVLRYREIHPAMAAIHKLHISVPSELSILGGLNCFFAEDCYPPLTCIRDYPEKYFSAALDLLLDIIEFGETDIHQIYTKCGLDVRESTGLVRAEKELKINVSI